MLFTRLDIQATEMVSTRPLGLVQKLDLQRLGNTSELPKVFDGLEEARLSQDYIHSCWRRSLQLVTPEGQDIATTPKEKFDAIKDGYIGKIQLVNIEHVHFIVKGPGVEARAIGVCIDITRSSVTYHTVHRAFPGATC